MRVYTKTSCVAVRLAVLYSLLPIAALLSGCSGQAANEKELKEKQIRELREEVAGVFGTKWILEKEDWCERHSVSDQEYDTLVKNWQNRTSYDGFSPSEAFWEVAKNSTPERLSKEFPALTDKEWFTAEIPTSIFNWRKFERPFSFGEEEPYKLSIWVRIRTVPNKPISRLQGLLSIKGPGGEELHSEMIDDQSDVSFQDSTVYQCEWNYDDNNPKHRTLRFSDGLSAHFDVRQVTFADGQTMKF